MKFKNDMNFEITGVGSLTITDLNTKEEFELGEIKPFEIEQEEFSANEEVLRKLNCLGMLNFEASSGINQETFDELVVKNNVKCIEFNTEWDAKILINARWHKKTRIRKKWLKRYGYKEDTIKMTAKCRAGEYNKETGESSFDIDELGLILRPDQTRRGLSSIRV